MLMSCLFNGAGVYYSHKNTSSAGARSLIFFESRFLAPHRIHEFIKKTDLLYTVPLSSKMEPNP